MNRAKNGKCKGVKVKINLEAIKAQVDHLPLDFTVFYLLNAVFFFSLLFILKR